MRRKSATRREQGRIFRFTYLLMAALIGCSNSGNGNSYFERWLQSATGNSAPSVNAPAPQPLPPATVKSTTSTAKSNSAVHRKASREQQAAIDARSASMRAQSAAEAAKKASDQAVEASREASQAAARAGNGNAADAASIAQQASANPASAGPGSSPAIVLSSANEATGEPNREQTAELIRGLSQSIAKIDPTTLDSNATKRRELAQSLVQSAQKALLQNNYLEANSLAMKASTMLAPLTGESPKGYSVR